MSPDDARAFTLYGWPAEAFAEDLGLSVERVTATLETHVARGSLARIESGGRVVYASSAWMPAEVSR